MIDLVKLHLQAGNGGNGRVSFRREKYVPKGGPDGGDGGNGGHIVIRGVAEFSSLHHLSGVKEYVAKSGQAGGKQKRKGAQGENLVIKVPVGTRIWLLAENEASQTRRQRYSLDYTLNRDEVELEKYYLNNIGEAAPRLRENVEIPVLEKSAIEKITDLEARRKLKQQYKYLQDILHTSSDSLRGLDLKKLPKQHLLEITEIGQEVILCQGGFGGRGNTAFRSSENTTPVEAEKGTLGESKVVIFEQLLLADIGLVGFPNAGKSTLISVLTSARPKIGNYPFTTLEPHLGVMPVKDREVVIADIPGLIDGASQGKGLGYTFLRHVEHCQLLLFVLYLTEEAVFNEELSIKDQAKQIYEQLVKLQQELDDYGSELSNKPALIGINKIDLYSPELIKAIKTIFAQHKHQVVFFSAATQDGISELVNNLAKNL